MEINESAPAIARSAALIAADIDTVWRLITDVGQWPEWNPDIKEVKLDGELVEGASFRWKSGPSTITSTVRQLDPPRFVGWTGTTMGIQAIHVWHLEQADGGTRVETEESWDGFPVRLLKGRMRKMLQEAIDSGLQHLKAEAERRAGDSDDGHVATKA